jgi:hypothetical protein
MIRARLNEILTLFCLVQEPHERTPLLPGDVVEPP